MNVLTFDSSQSLSQSKPEANIDLFEILGVVKSCKPIGPGKDAIRIMEVVSNTSQKEYKIYNTFFCPARRGDVLTGNCIKTPDNLFRFVQCPVVEPPSSREAVQTAFIVGLGKLKMPRWLSDKLYDFFLRETQERLTQKDGSLSMAETPIKRNRTDLNAAVMEMINWYAFTYFKQPEILDNLINVGLSSEQAEKLMKWWYNQQVVRRLYLLGLTKKEIRECCDRGWCNGPVWENSPSALYYQLLENPYIVERLPLVKAHEIARRYQLRFGQDIIECADLVRFIDEKTADRGWACHPIYPLLRRYPRFFELQSTLKRHYQCTIRYNFLYLRYQAEVEDLLVELLASEEMPRKTHASKRTQEMLCDEQVRAVEMVLNNTVSLITGSAGTGKSTLVAALDHELELRGISYCIASFTGKAVARVKEVVKKTKNIFTLHMFLARPAEYPFEYLIIDEISMVPNELMAKVLMKLHYKQPAGRQLKVVMLGDPNQLQPIQWGDLFNQLLAAGNNSSAAGTIPRTHLVKDHRRTNSQGILFQNTNQFAWADELSEIIFEWGEDCQFVQGQLPELEALLRRLKTEGISHNQITVVSPYKELDDVNQICQKVFLNVEGLHGLTDAFDATWYVGARVMMTQKNFYDIDVMNGDEGIVMEVNSTKGYIRVLFQGGQDVNVPTYLAQINDAYDNDDTSDPLCTKFLKHSWAVTVHKSQGSEWQVVIFFVRAGRNSSTFFNCNLLYTGISRAKLKLYVVANAKTSFESAIYVHPPKRHDNLARRMQGDEFETVYRDSALEHTRKLIAGAQ